MKRVNNGVFIIVVISVLFGMVSLLYGTFWNVMVKDYKEQVKILSQKNYELNQQLEVCKYFGC